MLAKRFSKRLILWTEFTLLLLAYALLILAVALIFLDSLRNLTGSHFSIVLLISNALLLLVIKEILWTIFRFFNRQKFSLSPFLYVGVISGIREMMFLSIKNSIEQTTGVLFTIELLANAAVILMLVFAYYLFKKARVIAGEPS